MHEVRTGVLLGLDRSGFRPAVAFVKPPFEPNFEFSNFFRSPGRNFRRRRKCMRLRVVDRSAAPHGVMPAFSIVPSIFPAVRKGGGRVRDRLGGCVPTVTQA
eukprot:1483520-Rhodomonas_salina.1